MATTKPVLLLPFWFPHPLQLIDHPVTSNTSSRLANNGKADVLIGFLFLTKPFTLHLEKCHFFFVVKKISNNESHISKFVETTGQIHCLMITSFIFRGGCVRGVLVGNKAICSDYWGPEGGSADWSSALMRLLYNPVRQPRGRSHLPSFSQVRHLVLLGNITWQSYASGYMHILPSWA